MVSSPREARVYDAFNPEARGIVWDYMNRYMFQLGMSAWWMDATEPEFYGAKQSDFNFQTKEGALRNVRNIYPLYTSKAIWDNQRATTLDKRVYILTRSAYIGSQRYGAGSWSGDIRASFDVFKKQIPAGLNFRYVAFLIGIPILVHGIPMAMFIIRHIRTLPTSSFMCVGFSLLHLIR